MLMAVTVITVVGAKASNIYISDVWLKSYSQAPDKDIALYCEGLGTTDSFEIEACGDITKSLWDPVYRHSPGYDYAFGYGYGDGGGYGYGYGSGSGSSAYSGGYGYGYGFRHSLLFGYGYGGGFEWSSNYTNSSGKTFFRIKVK
jgi:hypothetical protein